MNIFLLGVLIGVGLTVAAANGITATYVLQTMIMTGLGYEPLSALLADIRPVI